MQNFDCPVEPTPIGLARRGLDPAPRKFADPHPGEAGFDHPPRIFRPLRLGPVLGVITYSQAHRPCLWLMQQWRQTLVHIRSRLRRASATSLLGTLLFTNAAVGTGINAAHLRLFGAPVRQRSGRAGSG